MVGIAIGLLFGWFFVFQGEWPSTQVKPSKLLVGQKLAFRQFLGKDYSLGPIDDFDGDGEDEVIAYGPGQQISLVEANASLTQLPQAMYPALGIQSLSSWDADGDGDAEFMVATNEENHLLAADMQGHTVFESRSYFASWGTADLDGDGHAELLVAPAGSFRSGKGYSGATSLEALAPGGKPVWKLNEGVNNFFPSGDLDGDGKDELVVQSLGATWPLAIPFAVGWSQKKVKLALPKVFSAPPVSCFDLNGDGKDEIVFESGGYLDQAHQRYVPIKGLSTGYGSIPFDVDGDGALDIVVADELNGQWSAYNQSGTLIHKANVGDYIRSPRLLHTKAKNYVLIDTSYSGSFIYP